MELQRGVCVLCTESNKILSASDIENYINLIPKVLNKKIAGDSEFQKVKSTVKLCLLCAHKLQIANDTRKSIKSVKLPRSSDEEEHQCRFCCSSKDIAKVKNDWKFLTDRVDGYVDTNQFPLHICLRCFYYFDIVFNFKNNLLHKFPQLSLVNKPSPTKSALRNNNDTPKRKSLSKSPPSSKKRKIFDNCFDYLQPLSSDVFSLTKRIRRDHKFYKKIPYVDLSKNARKTPKNVRPVIKIKLKTKYKKIEKVIDKKKRIPVVRLSRSEECPLKLKCRKPLRRNSSYVILQNPEERSIEETPKVGDASELAPKRRVSMLIQPMIEEEQQAEKEPEEEESEEVNGVSTKELEGEEENDKSNDANVGEEKENNVEVNGIEERNGSPELNGDDKEESPERFDKTNGENVEYVMARSEDESSEDEAKEEQSSQDPEPGQNPSSTSGDKISVGSTDNDGSDRESEDLSESLDKKKKHVTFSDEISSDEAV